MHRFTNFKSCKVSKEEYNMTLPCSVHDALLTIGCLRWISRPCTDAEALQDAACKLNGLKIVLGTQQCRSDSQLARTLTSLTNMQTPCRCRGSHLQLCCQVANVFNGCEDMQAGL